MHLQHPNLKPRMLSPRQRLGFGEETPQISLGQLWISLAAVFTAAISPTRRVGWKQGQIGGLLKKEVEGGGKVKIEVLREEEIADLWQGTCVCRQCNHSQSWEVMTDETKHCFIASTAISHHPLSLQISILALDA